MNLPEVYAFIVSNGGSKRLLKYFSDAPLGVNSTTYQFDTDLVKEPYYEFSWLFAWVTG